MEKNKKTYYELQYRDIKAKIGLNLGEWKVTKLSIGNYVDIDKKSSS